MFEECEFCEKWDFELENFVKNKIFKMWIFGCFADFCPSVSPKVPLFSRLFCADSNLANEEIENLNHLSSSLDVSMLLTEDQEDSLEVIFLDIEGNLSKEQQRCLDLFQELPDFWQDFLQR